MKKNKSFLASYAWVGVMLILMGLLFGGIGAFFQIVSLEPDQITHYRNGVRVLSTEETVSTFRYIFLFIFGGFGIIMLTIGSIVLGKNVASKRLAGRLKGDGVRVYAQVYELTPSNVSVNGRRLMRLCCTYSESPGTVYVFKSGLLRANPTPFLRDDRITVYYDRSNMRRYFVDIDGSVAERTRIVEL